MLKKINSGKFPDGCRNAKQAAAGVRMDPMHFKGVLSDEQIFTALVGRDGLYVKSKDIIEKVEKYDLDVEWGGVPSEGFDDDSELFPVLRSDWAHHEHVFDSLSLRIDIIFPDPVEEVVEDKKQKPVKSAPFA